jgi:cytochrome c peroxidase
MHVMKKILVILLLLGTSLSCQQDAEWKPSVAFRQPGHFPAPVYDLKANPITREGFELGRALFYDGILSRDGSISCGNCHQQPSGFTQHGHDLSHGIDDLLTKRNSQPIMNLAWNKEFLWDGGVFHLDLFAVVPIEEPNEMDESLKNVLDKLRQTPHYPRLFERAFGTPEINTVRFLEALSQFQLMCISDDSPYDRYVNGNQGVLTMLQKEGLAIMEQKCQPCHAGPLFTDMSYRNNGLSVGNPEDKGRGLITLDPNDDYKFRVPSLRNVEVTRPYMHDGRLRSLERVLDHYDSGMKESPTLDPIFRKDRPEGKPGISLNDQEKRALIAFMRSLTDETFLNDPQLSEFNPLP